MEPKINPEKRDLLIMNEQLVEDPTMSTAVMLRVTTQRGSVPGLPWFGSRLHTLTTLRDTSARIAEGFLLEALGDLVRTDKIRNVNVEAEVDGTALKWQLSWEDQASQRQTLVSG
jgi:phage gp46-like protein